MAPGHWPLEQRARWLQRPNQGRPLSRSRKRLPRMAGAGASSGRRGGIRAADPPKWGSASPQNGLSFIAREVRHEQV
jgi:hypothetical protein